jgi:hypothetical protein
MPPARARDRPWPAARAWIDGLGRVADALRTPGAGDGRGRVAGSPGRLGRVADWLHTPPGAADGLGRIADALRAPHSPADGLDEARELLAYWERRARRLPRWALKRRREARATAGRWRARVRDAEQVRYGRGVLGAASQLAVERRMPATLAHRGRQAARLACYTAVATAVTLALVLAAAVAMVVEAVLGAL